MPLIKRPTPDWRLFPRSGDTCHKQKGTYYYKFNANSRPCHRALSLSCVVKWLENRHDKSFPVTNSPHITSNMVQRYLIWTRLRNEMNIGKLLSINRSFWFWQRITIKLPESLLIGIIQFSFLTYYHNPSKCSSHVAQSIHRLRFNQ